MSGMAEGASGRNFFAQVSLDCTASLARIDLPWFGYRVMGFARGAKYFDVV